MRIIDLTDVFEQKPYLIVGVGGDVFAFGPFDTVELTVENLKRLVARDEESGHGMLDTVFFAGVGQMNQLELVRYDIRLVSGSVFAQKLPWEKS
jgi:hypothetical protein